jgi:hypothetical protein
MTFQEIRIIATGTCIVNQLRDVNVICRRSWYIAAHIWKIYDFKIEDISFILPLFYPIYLYAYMSRSFFKILLKIRRFMKLEPLISHTSILMTFYLSIILDLPPKETNIFSMRNSSILITCSSE